MFRKTRLAGRVVSTDRTEHQGHLKQNDPAGLDEYPEAVVDAGDD